MLKTIEEQSGGRIKTGILPGEGAFYGPKFEYTLKDAIGREWQCGTTQVDFNLPERFGAFYIDQNSEKTQPVMIHRAICGSMERFLGILIENFAGHMPLWFAPLQVVVATITSDADDYGREVAEALREAGLQVETDFRNEKINYKVREHSVDQGAGDHRLRQARGGGAHRQHPPPRFAGPDVDDAGRGDGVACRRGDAAGSAAQGSGRKSAA